MAGKFELYESGNGEFRFRLKSGNGENLLGGEGYASKARAQGGIESVRKNAPDDNCYERKDSSGGQFYFVLKAANSEIIGTSEMYASPSGRDEGIETVKRTAPDATVEDLTS